MAPRPPEEELVTLQAAARRLKVHYMTAYRHVRLGYLPAEQRHGRWWVRPADLEAAVAPRPIKKAPHSRAPTSWAGPARRLAGRLLAGDLPGSWGVVEAALAGGATPGLVYVELLGRALASIGRGWEKGALSVEDEHRATAVAVRLMGRMSFLSAHRGRRAEGTVVLGAAPGDPHLLPVAMVADVARQHGWRVVELGANVPVASFAEAVGQAEDLVALGLSVADSACRAGASQVIAEVRALRPGAVVMAGGPALPDKASATRLGADLWAPDALAAARLLGELVGNGPIAGHQTSPKRRASSKSKGP